MTGRVQGKVALVTGGASGIGAAVAELLVREGASVAVTDIDDLKGPEVVAGIQNAGHEAVFLLRGRRRSQSVRVVIASQRVARMRAR